MRATALKGLPVGCESSHESVGVVDDLVLDLDTRRVLALMVRRNDGTETPVTVDALAFDEESVTIRDRAAIFTGDERDEYATRQTFDDIVDEKAMTESGDILGKVVDVEINTSHWTISAYDLAGDLTDVFEHGEQRLPADQVLVSGAHMLLVKEGAGSPM